MSKKQTSYTTTLSALIEGNLLHAAARRLSPRTIELNEYVFGRLSAMLGGSTVANDISADDIARFLAAFDTISASSVHRYHIALSGLWEWARKEGLVESNVVRDVERPRLDQTEIIPFTEDEIKALIRHCERTRRYKRPRKLACDNRRATALRDQAIVMLMVDTGVRASELCSITIEQVDLKNNQVAVFGKGRKERTVPFDPRTAQVIWKYLSTDRKDARMGDPLFATSEGTPLDRDNLRHMLIRLGQRAGVADSNPHRFRHTFAINYLRNGGDIFTLQKILGHASLNMVRKYLSISNSDVNSAHRKASPVANWRL